MLSYRACLSVMKYLYGGAGWVLHLNQSVSFLLEFVHLALMGQQAVVLKVLIESKSKWRYLCIWSSDNSPSHFLGHISCQECYPSLSDLILPADVRWVHNAVTPVLLYDLILFIPQEVPFLLGAVHVLVQSVQVVAAPFGVVLRRKKMRLN